LLRPRPTDHTPLLHVCIYGNGKMIKRTPSKKRNSEKEISNYYKTI
jgi:hypothetical protein